MKKTIRISYYVQYAEEKVEVDGKLAEFIQ